MKTKCGKIDWKHRLGGIYDALLAEYGPQACFLTHGNAFELLCAVVLSAQCTDRRVNCVTPELFRRWPDAAALAGANPDELEFVIRSCGFFHAKAANLIAAAKKIVADFGGSVPHTMAELTSLPGVGRKTANVLLGDAFGVPGLPVDTHVKRLMNLVGAVHSDDPEKIETVLCAALPPEKWAQFSHLVILHGRTRCPAGRPDCANCVVRSACDRGKGAK